MDGWIEKLSIDVMKLEHTETSSHKFKAVDLITALQYAIFITHALLLTPFSSHATGVPACGWAHLTVLSWQHWRTTKQPQACEEPGIVTQSRTRNFPLHFITSTLLKLHS